MTLEEYLKSISVPLEINQSIVLPSIQNEGIKVDNTGITDTIMDLKGVFRVDTVGANAPTLETWKGGVKALAYNASDIATWVMHVEHWTKVGGDKYIHAHVRHNGTAITGDLVLTFEINYNFGHNRVGSPANIIKTLTIPSASISSLLPQYDTNIQDILIAQSGGGVDLLDSDTWLPDDDIIVQMTVTTLPTITGGTTNKIFVPYVDIHCESLNIGTKNASPPFWG